MKRTLWWRGTTGGRGRVWQVQTLEGQRPQTKPETGRGPRGYLQCEQSALPPLNPTQQRSRRSRQLRFTDPAKQWAALEVSKRENGSVWVEGCKRTGVGAAGAVGSGQDGGHWRRGISSSVFNHKEEAKCLLETRMGSMFDSHCGHFGGPFFVSFSDNFMGIWKEIRKTLFTALPLCYIPGSQWFNLKRNLLTNNMVCYLHTENKECCGAKISPHTDTQFQPANPAGLSVKLAIIRLI